MAAAADNWTLSPHANIAVFLTTNVSSASRTADDYIHLPRRQQITTPVVKTTGLSMAAAAGDWMLSPHADIAEFSWPETEVQSLEPPTSRHIYHTGWTSIFGPENTFH